ncbi:MAG: CHRD domain-containing protein [Pyrinomonadaceae bacterium]
MKRAAIVLCLLAFATASAVAFPQGFKLIKEFLSGYEEVPSVSTGGSGTFNAKISKDGSQIEYELKYTELEGTVQQAHIHFGNVGVNGGITVFLCTNLGNGPAGIQPCPAPPATISGTILAADVSPNIPVTQAARNQGLNTGEIDELIRAMRAGATYVNVHSTTWPGGEIRSQIDGNNSHNH